MGSGSTRTGPYGREYGSGAVATSGQGARPFRRPRAPHPRSRRPPAGGGGDGFRLHRRRSRQGAGTASRRRHPSDAGGGELEARRRRPRRRSEPTRSHRGATRSGGTSRSSQTTPTARTASRFPPLLVEHRVKSMVNVVIRCERAAWGVLEVDSRQRKSFNEDDVSFLQNYANLIAAAIDRLQDRGEPPGSGRSDGLSSRRAPASCPEHASERPLPGAAHGQGQHKRRRLLRGLRCPAHGPRPHSGPAGHGLAGERRAEERAASRSFAPTASEPGGRVPCRGRRSVFRPRPCGP